MSYRVNCYPEGVPRSRPEERPPGIHLKNQGKTKTTTDALGNSTREHWNDRVDVTVKPKTVQILTTVKGN